MTYITNVRNEKQSIAMGPVEISRTIKEYHEEPTMLIIQIKCTNSLKGTICQNLHMKKQLRGMELYSSFHMLSGALLQITEFDKKIFSSYVIAEFLFSYKILHLVFLSLEVAFQWDKCLTFSCLPSRSQYTYGQVLRNGQQWESSLKS